MQMTHVNMSSLRCLNQQSYLTHPKTHCPSLPFCNPSYDINTIRGENVMFESKKIKVKKKKKRKKSHFVCLSLSLPISIAYGAFDAIEEQNRKEKKNVTNILCFGTLFKKLSDIFFFLFFFISRMC